MPQGPATEDMFSPEAFFARAAARISRVAPDSDAARGDHVLNPGFRSPDAVYRDAAVLIPVVARPTVSMLLTRRPAHLTVHAGQVAFPGGKIEPSDAGPAAAALREASEEIGLEAGKVETVGYLDPYLTGTGFRIVPVVARVAPDMRLALNPGEVEAAFEVPLTFLMSPKNHRLGSREFSGRRHAFYEMPYEGHHIWGITAGIIRALYERIFV